MRTGAAPPTSTVTGRLMHQTMRLLRATKAEKRAWSAVAATSESMGTRVAASVAGTKSTSCAREFATPKSPEGAGPPARTISMLPSQ